MTPRELFLAAFDIVRDPARWTRDTYWRDASARALDVTRDGVRARVTRCCSLGAMRFVAPEETEGRRIVSAALRIEMGAIDRFNDNHEHHEVVAAWERAGRAQGWLS